MASLRLRGGLVVPVCFEISRVAAEWVAAVRSSNDVLLHRALMVLYYSICVPGLLRRNTLNFTNKLYFNIKYTVAR